MESALEKLINRRASARRYLDKPVERRDIERCIEAARLAPSACNSQPWTFITVDDKAIKDTLCDRVFSGVYGMNRFAKAAPVIIAVVSEKSTFAASLGGQFRGTRYCLIDIGIACEHISLMAEELGLGTCMLGWFNEKGAKRILNIPNNKKVDLLISLGYYEKKDREKRRKPMDKIHFYNKYR